jgi:thiol-disulfide isomerase/thioredoxin
LKLILLAAILTAQLSAAIIPAVRAALAKQDFATAEKLIATQKGIGNWTPELLEAKSWLGRAHLAAKHYDQAMDEARATRKLCLAALKGRSLDAEKRLPIALGATIEVEGQALAGKGQLSESISYLNGELKTYYKTSIRTRIQKNINLLSLVGKPAPALEVKESIGSTKPLTLAQMKGKPVVLFFWAHWCGDCKNEAPILAELAAKYAPKGLVVVGPTQRYGYVARGEDATPAQEKPYIEEVFSKFYSAIPKMASPLSEENFRVYGASTTPTMVIIDKTGIVRTYNPGNLSLEELEKRLLPLL